MKKLTKALCLLFVSILFVACKGDDGPMGPQGPEGVETKQYTININKNDWKLSGKPGDLNSFYYAERQLFELSEYVFYEGAVIAYIKSGQWNKNGLPYVLHKGENINGKEFLWTQTYDFDFEVGYVTFYLTYSDFETTQIPDTETFHVVLIW